jgi:nitric oxide reductase large subunit
MTQRSRAVAQIVVLVLVLCALFLLFPRAYAFAEMAARELRYLWWLILLLVLGVWLIWGIGRKPKP